MKTVIEMALDTGFDADDETTLSSLRRFAELVRADERKKVRAAMKKAHVRLLKNAIAAERHSWPAEMEAMERQVNILTDALAEEREKWMERTAILIRGEREACAKVCDELQSPPDWNLVAVLWKECRSKLAAAIRARGNT